MDFGAPNKGIHTHVFGVAIVDVIMTIGVAWIIARIFKLNLIWTTICLFILGIIAHRIFKVRTTVDKLLF
jgi:hypothetical protein